MVEKADTPKFLGKLHQNRHTTRGLSVKTAELLLLVLTVFFLFNMLLISKLKIHLFMIILLLVRIMTSKMETLSFQFSVLFFFLYSFLAGTTQTRKKLYNLVVFSLISSSVTLLPSLFLNTPSRHTPDASLLPSRTTVFD